jgi:hypothetical protein
MSDQPFLNQLFLDVAAAGPETPATPAAAATPLPTPSPAPSPPVGEQKKPETPEKPADPAKEKKSKPGKTKNPEVAKLRSMIASYKESKRLGPALKSQGYDIDKALKLKDPEALTAALDEIDQVLARKGNNDIFDVIARGTVGTVEALSAGTRLKLQGLTEKCFADEYWTETLERVRLRHGLGSLIPNIPPLMQLALCTWLTATTVHKENSANALSAKVSPDMAKEILGPDLARDVLGPAAQGRPDNIAGGPADLGP